MDSSTRTTVSQAWSWTALAMVAAVVAVGLLMLPFRPGGGGWDELGWFLMLLMLGAGAALVTGTLTLWHRLRAAGAPYAGQTALMFVPVALLLGAVSAGLGALAAPPVAWWLVQGLHRPAEPGWGSTATTGLERLTATGVWPRVLLSVVVVGIGVGWVLDEVGHRYGGEIHGFWITWATAVPIAIAVPFLLLFRRSLAVAAVLAAAGLLFAVPVAQEAVRNVHPSVERLARDVDAVALPAGTSREQRVVTTVADSFVPYDLPVVVVGADATLAGDLEPVTSRTSGALAPPTARGIAVADEWGDSFVEAGWQVETTSEPPALRMPVGLQPLLERDGVVHVRQGLWVNAFVLPSGDGAVVLVVTRP